MVRLAERFTFVHKDARDGTVYTAEETDTGDYRVSWLADRHSQFKSTNYFRDEVTAAIVDGDWIIREVFPKREEENIEKIKLIAFGVPFELTKKGDDYILYTADFEVLYTYSKEQIDTFIAQGGWKYPEEALPPSLETGDDIVSEFVGTFPKTTGEPDLLPPDDIPDLVPESLSLEAVRKFVKECPTYTLELDEEYMVVKPLEDAHGERNVVYLVKTEVELEAVMEAIRTLEKYADRG